jgi:uncharacterized protein
MRSILAILFVFSVVTVSTAADPYECIKSKPKEKALVFQYVQSKDFLSDAEIKRLDDKLKAFAVETSNQIVVVIVDTLCGLEPWEYATELGEKWGVGGQPFDNGVVLLVKPLGVPGRRFVHIATGRGLGGAIPDITCKQIVNQEIIPEFKNGRPYVGLDKGTNVLMALAKSEYDFEAYGKANKPGFPWPVLLFFLFMIFIIFMGFRSRVKRYAKLNSLSFWDAWWLLSQADNRHPGGWRHFSGGGFGGRSSGGGFGGFGGGSFGGGGAGGSW